MAYNPSQHTVSNKSYGVAQSVPTDGRSWYYDAALFLSRPYQSTSEVLSYLNLPKYRSGHFSIYINIGGTLSSGVFTGGTIAEYWFKDGTSDSDLIIKTDTTITTQISDITPVTLAAGATSWPVPASTLIEMYLVQEATTITFKVGITVGGTEIVGNTTATPPTTLIQWPTWFPVATTIYFGGVTGSTVIKIIKRKI